MLGKSIVPRGHRQELDGSNYAFWRACRRAATALRPRLPELSTAFDDFAYNLGAMVAIAREHGVRPIFLTQPTLWRADLEPELRQLTWMGGVGDYMHGVKTEYYTIEALAEGMALYNEVLRRFCERNGVEYVDLAALLPKDLSVFYDDCHFNESGARRVAEAVAARLVPETERRRAFTDAAQHPAMAAVSP
jgi:lysophospholipase L1-like esterase